MIPPHLFERLRNLPARKIIRALQGDGFTYRKKKGAGRLYRHFDPEGGAFEWPTPAVAVNV